MRTSKNGVGLIIGPSLQSNTVVGPFHRAGNGVLPPTDLDGNHVTDVSLTTQPNGL